MSKLDIITELYDDMELLKADGFDDAIIGVDTVGSRLVYSVDKVIMILKSQGLSEDEAYEHFEFNIEGAYVGEHTPIWCHDDFV